MRSPILDYYAVLGVHPTAEDIVIRAAYKALAQRYHPDRFAGSKDEAHRRMSDLTKAYEVLADPLRRPKYDRRRITYAQSVAARFNGSPKYAPPAIDPGDPRPAGAMRTRFRAALSALMIVVVVLSAVNLFHYSTRLKEWLGAGTARSPNLPISQGSATTPVEIAAPRPAPSPPLDTPAAPAAVTPADTPSVKEKPRAAAKNAVTDRPANGGPTPSAPAPCRDVVAALGLCNPNITAKNK